MEINQTNLETHGLFTASINHTVAGKLTYIWKNTTTISIDHVEAAPQFKGQGVGLHLLMKAVEFARNENLKIIPLCPYAKLMFERKTEIQDVLFN